jgi:hypothetical protein
MTNHTRSQADIKVAFTYSNLIRNISLFDFHFMGCIISKDRISINYELGGEAVTGFKEL